MPRRRRGHKPRSHPGHGAPCKGGAGASRDPATGHQRNARGQGACKAQAHTESRGHGTRGEAARSEETRKRDQSAHTRRHHNQTNRSPPHRAHTVRAVAGALTTGARRRTATGGEAPATEPETPRGAGRTAHAQPCAGAGRGRKALRERLCNPGKTVTTTAPVTPRAGICKTRTPPPAPNPSATPARRRSAP